MSKRSKRAKQARKILREARILITPFGNWTQQTEARDYRGTSVRVTDKSASTFCAVGAVNYVIYVLHGDEFTPEERRGLARDVGNVLNATGTDDGEVYTTTKKRKGRSIVDFNDSNGTVTADQRHKTVLEVFDAALETADVLYPPVEMMPATSRGPLDQ